MIKFVEKQFVNLRRPAWVKYSWPFVLLTSIPFHTSVSGPVCVLRTDNQGCLHSFPLGELGKRQTKGCFKDEIQVVQERATILRGDGGVWRCFRCFKRVREWESRSSPFVLKLVIYEQLAFSSDLHLLAHLPSILGQMEQRRHILVGRRWPWLGGRPTWAPSCCGALKFEGLMISWKKKHILQTHQGRPQWESCDYVLEACVYSTRTYNIACMSVLYKACQKIYTSLAKCSLARFSLRCEQSNCFLSIYHSQFAYAILCGVLACQEVEPAVFSFFLLCRVSGERRKEQSALRPPCFPLFVSVCFCCLVERCINVRQNVRLPLQRPICSKPHICWNYNNQSGRFQLSSCLWTRWCVFVCIEMCFNLDFWHLFRTRTSLP